MDNIISAVKPNDQSLYGTDQAKVIQEVQAQVMVAKRWPRNLGLVEDNIKRVCQDSFMAEQALYTYPQGGETVTGASIRLAECLAQQYGNLVFGTRELEQDTKLGHSIMQTYCWDLETNNKVHRDFQLSHSHKAHGQIKKITDPKRIYEHVQNFASRRLRACILQVIPQHIVKMATDEVTNTLQQKLTTPVGTQIEKIISAFAKKGVSKQNIIDWLDHDLNDISQKEIIELRGIHQAIKDGQSSPSDYFSVKEKGSSDKTDILNKKLSGNKEQ